MREPTTNLPPSDPGQSVNESELPPSDLQLYSGSYVQSLLYVLRLSLSLTLLPVEILVCIFMPIRMVMRRRTGRPGASEVPI